MTDRVSDARAERSALAASWDANAAAWTRAVREGHIPSRRAATDAAAVAACAAAVPRLAGARVLDVGCGEGWLARALAVHGARVLGIDGSAGLIDAARGAEGMVHDDAPAGAPPPEYAVVDYDALTADRRAAPGPFDLVVCNFALLGDPIAPLLAALAGRLAPGGTVVVQTVHPWVAAGDAAYADGWRLERFDAFSVPFPAHMPWYFRTLAGWGAALREAGLGLVTLAEPVHPESGRPLSLMLTAAPTADPSTPRG